MSHYLLASLLLDVILGLALLLLWRVQPDNRTPCVGAWPSLAWGWCPICIT